MSSQLPGVLHSPASVLDRHGHTAVIILVGVEGFGIPLPGQTVLLAAGIYAGTGKLNVIMVLALGFLAAAVGDNIGYVLGRCGGQRLVLRFGRCVLLTEERVAATERFFAKRGNIVVPVARFIDGLRQANGIVAGMAHMGWWRFLAYNALGGAAWVGLWALTGYLAGDHIGAIYGEFQRYQKYVLAAVGVIAIAVLLRWILKRRSSALDT